jgi:hypothetical protein
MATLELIARHMVQRTLELFEMTWAIILVTSLASPQKFMQMLAESQLSISGPNSARFLSNSSAYNHNISVLQRGLEEFSVLSVVNTYFIFL